MRRYSHKRPFPGARSRTFGGNGPDRGFSVTTRSHPKWGQACSGKCCDRIQGDDGPSKPHSCPKRAMSSATPAHAVTHRQVHPAASAPSPGVTAPAASRRCPGSRNSCACRHPSTAGPGQPWRPGRPGAAARRLRHAQRGHSHRIRPLLDPHPGTPGTVRRARCQANPPGTRSSRRRSAPGSGSARSSRPPSPPPGRSRPTPRTAG